jgi:lycopene cyclase domain-containing protein
MSLYIGLDLLVMAAPILLSFDRRVRYVKRWPAVLASSAVVGILFLIWDAFMASRGAWVFSEFYAGQFRLFHLPPGEFLFFLAVPFACVFIYEVVSAYVPEKTFPAGKLPWLAAAAAFTIAATAAAPRLYTSTVLAVTALFFLSSAVFAPALLSSGRFWISIAISYVPFLISNGVLTALPVVTYSDEATLGIRAWTIPLEDFFYSFSLLGFVFFAYSFFRGKR